MWYLWFICSWCLNDVIIFCKQSILYFVVKILYKLILFSPSLNTWQHLPHSLFCGPLVLNLSTELFCKQSPVFVNNHRFTEFLTVTSTFLYRSTVTKHELGLPFPARNLRIKLGANASTVSLVIVVTHTNQRRWKHIPSLSRSFLAGQKVSLCSTELQNPWTDCHKI